MHQSGFQSMTEKSILNLSWLTNTIHFLIKWTLKRGSKSEQVMEGSLGPEMDHISHLELIQNTLLCHAMRTILLHVGPLLCIFVYIMCDPMTPPWLALTPLPFQESIYYRKGSYKSLGTNLLCHALDTILMHFGAFWCILVHLMCNPMTPPWLALTPILFQVSIQSRNG